MFDRMFDLIAKSHPTHLWQSLKKEAAFLCHAHYQVPSINRISNLTQSIYDLLKNTFRVMVNTSAHVSIYSYV